MESKVFVVTSGKGGVGKTTATANIGTAMAMTGKNVLVIDLDIGLRNLDVVMGLENRVVFTVVDVIKGRCNHKKALIKDRRVDNLFLIPASQIDTKDAINEQEIRELCATLKKEFDYIFIDCPAGIEQGFKNAIAAADEAIVITTPDVSAVRDADRIIGLLDSESISSKLIINRINPELVARGDMLTHDDVTDILSIKLLGLVPLDDSITTSTNRGEFAVTDDSSPAGRAFFRIGQRLNGHQDLPIEVPQVKGGFMKKFRKIISGR
ncbi:MAG: septum site-determining protein MinD [Deltaproteobacteria bacterium]|nr:septum site-determining protein MinD [Deltaproteobacteria bacterium]